MRQCTDTAGNAMALAVDRVSRLKRAAGQPDLIEKYRFTCGGPVTVNELASRVAVVHRCFSERRFYSKRLLLGAFASKAPKQLTSFSG